MAIINVDDAYILNETGAQVDKTTGIPFKNESLTEAEAAQARANIRAGGSNDNLLDNAYFVGGGSQLGDGVFPINQRGQTVYASDGPGIDRWKQFAATVTLASDGVTVTPSAYSNNFLQLMNPAKWDALVGETVTLSIEVLAVTGTITVAGYNTGLGTITSTGIAAFTFTMPSGIVDGNKFFGIAGQSGSSIKFGRWKLEKGTVSTLDNDPPPDFGEELWKCMRRFRRIKAEAPYYVFATVLAEAAAYTIGMIDLPVPMARKPTISTNGSFRLWTGTGENPVAVSGIGIFDAICPLTNCSRIGIIASPSVNLTADARYDLQANNDPNAYIDLSCEL